MEGEEREVVWCLISMHSWAAHTRTMIVFFCSSPRLLVFGFVVVGGGFGWSIQRERGMGDQKERKHAHTQREQERRRGEGGALQHRGPWPLAI